MISWISSRIDIICLAETWEHEKSKVPNMEGFVLWSAWNKKSHRRGIGGIACYIRKNISPHIQLHKIDHLNQYIRLTILINTFATKQATLLSDDSNHNPLWLDEDLVLSNSYKRSSQDLIENLSGTELVKLCSSQDLIICNGVMKWPNSNQMTCIHGLGSSVVDYVISDILVSNQITTFDLLNDHESDSDHKPLTLTLKFSMHRSTIGDNYDNQRNLRFDKSKVDIFLKDLNSKLKLLTYKDNIEELYHNLTTTLFTSINKFSFEVSRKKNNRTTNPWYDKECKIDRKAIRDASNEPLKLDKINTYKALTKRKKRYYINKRQEQLSQLYKLDPKKFWSQTLKCNTKENNRIPLMD
jgi:hypothetical protein